MKILRITSDIYPYLIGGIGIHTHEMSQYQVNLGDQVTVYTIEHKTKQLTFPVNYKLVKNPKIFSIFGNSISPALFFRLYRIRYDYDIIHAHSHLFISTNICAFYRRIGSSPLIITNHGIMSASAPGWFNKIYLKTLGKWTLNSADTIICYTVNEREKLISFLNIDKNKIVVIPNGVNTRLFSPSSNQKKHKYPTLLWVGRFVEGKGVHYVISAIKTIVKDVPELQLILVGEGPLQSQIESLIIKNNLTDNVIIKKFLSYEEMPDIYRSCDIFVLPSLQEGVPRTVLEAMACGKPVVMTEFAHLSDLIADSGLTFPKGNVDLLADSLKQLINNDDMREQFGKNARNKVVNNYSWNNTVSRTITLYKEVLCQR